MSTASRTAVHRVLHEVFGQGSRVPEGWNAGLAPEDARFAQALLGLCLRRWGRLQALIQQNLTQPGREIPLGSRGALALGLASLAWMPGVAAHAAVDESVRLVADPELGFPPHKGLVNAILRRAAKDRAALADTLERLPWALDCPPFAQAILAAALGPSAGPDAHRALWTRLQAHPVPAFRQVRPEPLPPGLEPDPELPGALLLSLEAPFPHAWLASGAGMVQDRSSQALMAFRWPRPLRRILDVCAAPGGKTTALAQAFPQAELVALERSPARARRLRENLAARGVAAEVLVGDAVAWLQAGGDAFDLILLDAPCSGSGTLRKHPELAWVGSLVEVARLAREQRTLQEACLPRLAEGGLFVHAVCSWFPQEGLDHRPGVLARLLGGRPADLWAGPCAGPEPGTFAPDPLTWDGEGFRAFAVSRG